MHAPGSSLCREAAGSEQPRIPRETVRCWSETLRRPRVETTVTPKFSLCTSELLPPGELQEKIANTDNKILRGYNKSPRESGSFRVITCLRNGALGGDLSVTEFQSSPAGGCSHSRRGSDPGAPTLLGLLCLQGSADPALPVPEMQPCPPAVPRPGHIPAASPHRSASERHPRHSLEGSACPPCGG